MIRKKAFQARTLAPSIDKMKADGKELIFGLWDFNDVSL